MVRLLKRDWKSVGMIKEIMTDLIGRLQLVVTTMKKNLGNRLSTFFVINKHWGQSLYNWFYNIDNALGSNKFFHYLKTVVRQYKHTKMLVAL